MYLGTLQLVDNDLEGYTTLAFLQQQAEVILSLEKEIETVDEYAGLIEDANAFLERLGNGAYETIRHEMAVELTESAYGQGDYTPSEADVSDLEKELILDAVHFYEGSTVLIFHAPENYPDMQICCQVDDEGDIEDVSVYQHNS